jgi:RNA polymerase sigma-70 factor (ECF subfamily)
MSCGSSNAEVLLTQALAGAKACRGELLHRYSNYLKLLARAQLDERIRTRVSPSDVVQESLLEAHRDFSQFQGHCTNEFLAWLRQILVHNLAHVLERHLIAEKRDVRREVAIEVIGASLERSAMGLIHVLADESASPSAAAIQHEQMLALADALTELPDDYRDVIILRHMEALSFKVVAERMQRSEGAVRMLWLRAMDQLRSLLGKNGAL